eukprot:49737_1
MTPTILHFLTLISTVYCITFNLEVSEKFCLGEDAIEDDLLVGIFKYDRNSNVDGTIMLTVEDPFKNNKFKSEEESGSFSISVQTDGMYDFCFFNRGRTIRSVTLEIQNKFKSKKNDNLVKKKHVDPLVNQMENIIASAKHLVSDLQHLKRREWEMRDLNEATNGRVLTLSFLSITIFIIVAIVNIFYLKSFFKKKKLF